MQSAIIRTVAFALILATSLPTNAQARPNILFLYTDDQAAWALGTTNREIHTPHLDRLFAQGVTLPNSFVTTPVCSPSRVGLLASRYGTEMGITDWINPRGGNNQTKETHLGLDPSTPTWVSALHEAGYETALIGKWHLGELDRYLPSTFGYEHFFGFRTGGNKVENPRLESQGEVTVHPGLTTNLLTDEAIRFLSARDSDRPFMLSLHYRAPHAPWLPVEESDAAPYESLDPTIPNPDFPDLDIERVKRLTREYMSSVTSIDRNVGRVLTELESLGLADNTIVIFTSDHGYNIGHHGILHKGNGGWITKSTQGKRSHENGVCRPNMWDTSLRVPTAIRWPGVIEPGSTVTQTVTNLDWYPTILAMAGLSADEDSGIHGHDFSPLLRGKEIAWNNDFYGEYSIHHYTQAHLRMYRTTKWKLVMDFLNPGRDELYDLINDPGETVNLIDKRETVTIRATLEAKLLSRMRTLNDSYVPAKRLTQVQ